MTPLYWTPLLAAIWNLFVAGFVFAKNPGKSANQVFLLLGTSIAVWNLGTFQMFVVETHEQAIVWARFLHFGVLFLPVSLVHLSILVADIRARWLPHALYAFTLVMGATNFTDFYIRDVVEMEYAFYSQAGPGFWIFTPVLFSTITASIIVLVYKRKQSRLSLLQRRKLDFLIGGQSVFVLLGINDVLPILGIYEYPFTNIAVYPWGTLAAVFYGTVIAYGLLQHQLLDVHVRLGRISAQIIRMVFLLITLLLLFSVASFLFPEQITQEAIAISIGVLILSIIIVSILFPRLLGASSEKLERTILGDRFEYHDKIRDFNRSTQHYTDAEKLLDDMQSLLSDTVNVGKFAVLFKDDRSSIYSPSRIYPAESKKEISPMNEASPAIRLLEKSAGGYLALNPEYQTGFGSHQSHRNVSELGALHSFSPEFCFPFQSTATLFGFLLIGGKRDGMPYTAQDIALLSEMTRNASLILNQVRLKRQIDAQEEIELVGVMSKGLAHDLNNLFTPINTYFQLVESDFDPEADVKRGQDHLLAVAKKNMFAIQTYLREALFFADKLTPHCVDNSLAAILDESIHLCQHRLDGKKILIRKSYPKELPISADSVLLQRLFSNLIINAADASPSGSPIEINAGVLARNEKKEVWYRITVIDVGQGIPKHLQKRVFTPYFTTKDSGEKDRGAGLGLSICRKIVHLHGGTIQIKSTEKEGTTVDVDLPSEARLPT